VLLLVLACFSLAKRKKIDLEALEKKWAEEDGDDDDWHEDSFEWNEKERKKRSQEAMQGLMNGGAGGAGGGDMNAMLNMMGGGGGGGGNSMHMSFAQIREGSCEKRGQGDNIKQCLDELAGLWSGLLKTAAIEFKAYPLEPNTILFTAGGVNHHTQELKAFILSQPETEKWTFNSKDSYPDKETEIMSKAAAKVKKEKQDAEAKAKKAEAAKKLPKRKKKKRKKKKKKKKNLEL